MVFREFMSRFQRCLNEVKLRKQMAVRRASPNWPDTHTYCVMIDSMEAARSCLIGKKVLIPTQEQIISGLTTTKNYFASRKRGKDAEVLTMAINMLERREKMG